MQYSTRLKAAELFRLNVRTAMDARGLTIAEMADRSHMKRPNMSVILSGKQAVTLARAERIADALGLELYFLLSHKFEIRT